MSSSTVAIYSSLGEHWGITVKLGPLANRVYCAFVRVLKERLTTHLALVLLSTVVIVLVVAEVVVVVVVLVVAEAAVVFVAVIVVVDVSI